MPIKDKTIYPRNWKEISLRIRARECDKCKFCGAKNYEAHPLTGSRVILTVAHLDHNPGNNTDENLAALCQKCHLALDKDQHIATARATRQEKLGIIELDLFG